MHKHISDLKNSCRSISKKLLVSRLRNEILMLPYLSIHKGGEVQKQIKSLIIVHILCTLNGINIVDSRARKRGDTLSYCNRIGFYRHTCIYILSRNLNFHKQKCVNICMSGLQFTLMLVFTHKSLVTL